MNVNDDGKKYKCPKCKKEIGEGSYLHAKRQTNKNMVPECICRESWLNFEEVKSDN